MPWNGAQLVGVLFTIVFTASSLAAVIRVLHRRSRRILRGTGRIGYRYIDDLEIGLRVYRHLNSSHPRQMYQRRPTPPTPQMNPSTVR
jgi:hypothetical protein